MIIQNFDIETFFCDGVKKEFYIPKDRAYSRHRIEKMIAFDSTMLSKDIYGNYISTADNYKDVYITMYDANNQHVIIKEIPSQLLYDRCNIKMDVNAVIDTNLSKIIITDAASFATSLVVGMCYDTQAKGIVNATRQRSYTLNLVTPSKLVNKMLRSIGGYALSDKVINKIEISAVMAGVDVVPDGYLYLRERTGKVCNYMPLSMLHQKRAQLINTDTVYFDNYKIDMDNSFIRFNVAYDSVAVTFFYNE